MAKTQGQAGPTEMDPVYTRCRLLIVFLSQVCDITISSERKSGKEVRLQPANKLLRLATTVRDRLVEAPRVSLVVRLLYGLAAIKMLVYLYYQFLYDVQQMRLERLAGHASGADPTVDLLTRTTLEARRHYERMMNATGAPYRGVGHMAAPGSTLILMGISFVLYDTSSLYFRFLCDGLDSCFMAMILDSGGEMRKCTQMIERQMDKYLCSLGNCLANTALLGGGQLTELMVFAGSSLPRATSVGGRPSSPDATVGETRRQLERLLASGQLYPINRSAEWIRQMARNFIAYNLLCVSFCLVCIDCFVYIIPPIVYKLLVIFSLADVLTLCSIMYVNLVVVLAVSFYMSSFIVSGQDQSRYIEFTRQQLIECMRANKTNFESLSNESREQHSHFMAQMNFRLLLTLVRYKILQTQVERNQGLFKLLVNNAFVAALLPPIVVRLFAPYLEPPIKLLGVVFCMISLMFSLLALLPIGNQNHLVFALFKSLFSLRAQSIDIVGQLNEDCRRQLDWHTLLLIGKELADPKLSTGKFAPKMLSMPVTYPNIIKTHFWYGILLFSCLFDTHALRNLLGDRVDDPFGIFEHLVL